MTSASATTSSSSATPADFFGQFENLAVGFFGLSESPWHPRPDNRRVRPGRRPRDRGPFPPYSGGTPLTPLAVLLSIKPRVDGDN
jgi:hypothetical protein